jgi:hypothetical protein
MDNIQAYNSQFGRNCSIPNPNVTLWELGDGTWQGWANNPNGFVVLYFMFLASLLSTLTNLLPNIISRSIKHTVVFILVACPNRSLK